jgi:predicted nucleotidyltransferase
MVPPEIEAKREEIVTLRRRYGVVRLDLLGSPTIGQDDPFTSDYDFLVA